MRLLLCFLGFHRWTPGVIVSKHPRILDRDHGFVTVIREGAILARRCDECGHTMANINGEWLEVFKAERFVPLDRK